MKVVQHFKDFLTDTVNLNATRIQLLEVSIVAIKDFMRQCEYEPRIRGFVEQGSWAHDTIIKPVDDDEFDADLLVMVDPVDGWSAAQYVQELAKVFKGSPTYATKTKRWDYCVTITYAGDRKIDIAPCVVDREWQGANEVCNRPSDAFELSAPVEYTKWLVDQNSLSGQNSFRKVTRLLKYIRDIKCTFTCPSVLLMTMLGNQINIFDKGTDAFADTPSALKTLVGRLDDFLQRNVFKPVVLNPKLASEDFAQGITDKQYDNLRNVIHRYRGWIDEAYDSMDLDESIASWRKVFGPNFAKSYQMVRKADLAEGVSLDSLLDSTSAAHGEGLIDIARRIGVRFLPRMFFRPPHMKEPRFPQLPLSIFEVEIVAFYKPSRAGSVEMPLIGNRVVQSRGGIWFEARRKGFESLPHRHQVEWRVTNTGIEALQRHAGRGGFYPSTSGHRRWEDLQYRGIHFVEAFVVRMTDDTIVAQSEPFTIVIE
jgi:hypothetical protein